MKFFSMDSPLMQALNKMADLLWLNLLTLICCVPIITVGASLTAMHYMALKIVRDEDTYITKGFFKSFISNFRQGTAIWLIQVIVTCLIGGDIYIVHFTGTEFPYAFQVFIFVMALLVLLTTAYLYPLLAKFDNTVFKTIKNSLILGIAQFPKAVLMIVMSIAPIVLAVAAPALIPIVLMFGVSVPAYFSAKLYNKYFLKLEDAVTEANGPKEVDPEEEDERIFKDELDPVLESYEEKH